MNRPLLWSSLGFIALTTVVTSDGAPHKRAIEHDRLRSQAQLTPARAERDRSKRGAAHRGRNVFVNDPCLDPAPEAPPPANFLRTVQSSTDIAVLNAPYDSDLDSDDDHDAASDADDPRDDDSSRHDGGADRGRDSFGKWMVAGYNDSYGHDDNRQGVSGFSYSTDGGKHWIDAGGLPPRVPSGVPAGTPGSDAYLGDPSVVVHHQTKQFYYASLYQNAEGGSTLSVNRGEFRVAPQQVPVESFANTRCENDPAAHGIPDPPAFVRRRVIWEPPVEAVPPAPGFDAVVGTDDDDRFDKGWLYVNQETGVLYLTYTRIGAEGSTPLELVRSFDGGQTWTPPSVIVPSLDDTFNQGPQPVVTPTGRVVVTWFARAFDLGTFQEIEQRIEAAFSDNCATAAPCTFSPPIVVDSVNPQGKPHGYNRENEMTISNLPYIMVDKGRDDGVITAPERRRRGFGNVYITYFDGQTPLPQEIPFACTPDESCNPFARAADILLSRSIDNGTTYAPPVKVNDDPGDTSHVFPSVQVNKHSDVFVTWIDRRVDRPRNLLNDTWGDISSTLGASFRQDGRISTVSTDWISREDRIPDYGDYNSSDVVRFTDFIAIWADGRFPEPAPITAQEPPFSRPEDEAATPDTLSAIVKRNGSIKR
jgi:hypothetical protein